jgi:hypothetical protein
MRGGARMRFVGAGPSERLLKDPRLPARFSSGDSGGVTAGAAVAVLGERKCCRACCMTYLTVQLERKHGLLTEGYRCQSHRMNI